MLGVFVGLLLAACRPFGLGDPVALPDEAYPVARGVGGDTPLAEAVDAEVLAYLEAAQVPGLAVALVADGQPAYAAGYGWADLEAGRPLTPDTPVLLSSVSKTFVGVAALQAVEAGRVSLDAPASDHLPFPLAPSAEGVDVTLRHLLTHTSGIVDSIEYGRSYVEGDPETSLREFLSEYLPPEGSRYRRGHRAAREPGAAFEYSNVGMATAGLVLGIAAQREFAELLDEELLDPLGMTGTAYFLADLEQPPAVPYARAGRRFRPYPQYGFPTYPDGLLRSSAGEMGRYVAAILAGGELDGVRVLSTERVDALLTVDEGAGTDEDGQAIAWARREAPGRELYGHNGGDYGSATELWVDREAGVGIVTLFNAVPPSFTEWWELQQRLLDLAD